MKNHYSYLILHKVSDGDFQTIMESVQFSTTPREVVTVGDMENYYYKMRAMGVEVFD